MKRWLAPTRERIVESAPWGALVLAALLLQQSCGGKPKPQPVPEPEPPPPQMPAPAAQAPALPDSIPEPAAALEHPALPPDPRPGEPWVRIGLGVGLPSAPIGGRTRLLILDPQGAPISEVPAGEAWALVPNGGGVSLTSGGGWRSAPELSVRIQAEPGAAVTFRGRDYPGVFEIRRDRTGLTVINQVGLEGYLSGVVAAEMGRRSPEDSAAVRAQAIVSRTYTIRNRGRWKAQGFDYYASVVDQVYSGLPSDAPWAQEAVEHTAGQVLTFGGTPIDAFFYSTCGGRTAEGQEVFERARRPYLKSFYDQNLYGVAYCSISPRFRWRYEWSGAEILTLLQRTLPTVIGTSPEAITEVRSMRVSKMTGSGRVAEIAVGLRQGEVTVSGPAVRQVLRSTDQELLRSSAFTLTQTQSNGRLAHLVAEGSGAGHGVGFCQWGAVGRARSGQGHLEILSAYFPGTAVARLY